MSSTAQTVPLSEALAAGALAALKARSVPLLDQPLLVAQLVLVREDFFPIGALRGCRRAALPPSAQIIGPLYEDDTALTFAELLAQVLGGYAPPRI